MACEPQSTLTVFEEACERAYLRGSDRLRIQDVVCVCSSRQRKCITLFVPDAKHPGQRPLTSWHLHQAQNKVFIHGPENLGVTFIDFEQYRVDRMQNYKHLLLTAADLVTGLLRDAKPDLRTLIKPRFMPVRWDTERVVFELQRDITELRMYRRFAGEWFDYRIPLDLHGVAFDGSPEARILVYDTVMRTFLRGSDGL